MPRPRANPEQQRRAYERHRAGFGPKAIVDTLSEEFGDEAVSPRTVATWVKGFKDLSPRTVGLDSPFEWHRMEEYGLPWEAGGFLLDLAMVLSETWIGQANPGSSSLPTVRQARWWWRVHQAAPDVVHTGTEFGWAVGKINLILLAERFVWREMAHDVLGEPLEMDDLEAHLKHRPWESEERRAVYLSAVEQGQIPGLRLNKDRIAENTKRLEAIGETAEWAFSGLAMMAAGVNDDCPELLDSQQVERRPAAIITVSKRLRSKRAERIREFIDDVRFQRKKKVGNNRQKPGRTPNEGR